LKPTNLALFIYLRHTQGIVEAFSFRFVTVAGIGTMRLSVKTDVTVARCFVICDYVVYNNEGGTWEPEKHE